MDILYSSVWAGTTCLRHMGEVAALVIGILAGVLAVIAWLTIRFGGRATARENRQLAVWIVGGTGAFILCVVVYVFFFDAPIYRQITFAQNTFTFDGCQAAKPVVVDIPMAEIANIAYRGRWTSGKSPRFVQEIVLSRRDGETFLIPLSREAETTNHAALARILPPEVIDAYLAALDRRGWERPAAYGSRN